MKLATCRIVVCLVLASGASLLAGPAASQAQRSAHPLTGPPGPSLEVWAKYVDSGQMTLTTDTLKVHLRSAFKKPADVAESRIFTYVTRLHWNSKLLSLVPCSFTQHPSVPVPGNFHKHSYVGEECRMVPVSPDLRNLDGDGETDVYLEVFWDNSWPGYRQPPPPLGENLLQPVFNHDLFSVQFNLLRGTERIPEPRILPTLALAGKDTYLRTTGELFYGKTEGQRLLRKHVGNVKPLQVKRPAVEVIATATQVPTGLVGDPKVNPPDGAFGVGFDAKLSLSAKGTLNGKPAPADEPYPLCGVELRWFWNSKSFTAPTAKECSVTADPRATLSFSGAVVLGDSLNLDGDPTTDLYCRVNVEGNLTDPTKWTTNDASAAFQTGSGFETVRVNTQIAYATVCDELTPGIWKERYTSAGKAITINHPTASMDFRANRPSKGFEEACLGKGDCKEIRLEVDAKFDGHDYFPAPSTAVLQFFYESSKLSFRDTDDPGTDWKFASATEMGVDKEDNQDRDHDPHTDKVLTVYLEPSSWTDLGCPAGKETCTIPWDTLVEMPVKQTPGFLSGKARINVHAFFGAQDSKGGACPTSANPLTVDCPVDVRVPKQASVAIEGPEDRAYQIGKSKYLTLYGPTEKHLATHENGPWFLGFTPETCAGKDPNAQANEQACPKQFHQLLAISGTMDWPSKPPRTVSPSATDTLTARGLIQADILSADKQHVHFQKLACGQLTLKIGTGETKARIEPWNGCKGGASVDSYIDLAGGAAGVDINAIDLVKSPAGLEIDGGLWVDNAWGGGHAILIPNQEKILRLDGQNKTALGADTFQVQTGTLNINAGYFEIKDAKLTYSPAEDRLSLQGMLTLRLWPTKSSSPTLVVNLGPQPDSGQDSCHQLDHAPEVPGEIVFQNGSVWAKGTVEVQNLLPAKKTGGLQIKDLYLGFDTASGFYAGCADLCFPKGKGSNPGEDSFCLVGGLGFLDGHLESFLVGVEHANIEIGDTGAYFQAAHISAKNLHSHDLESPITLEGDVEFTFGPEISVDLPSFLGGSQTGALGTLDVKGTVDRNGFDVKGDVYMLGKMIHARHGSVDAVWAGENPHIGFSIPQSMWGGALKATIDGEVGWGPSWEFSAEADADLSIPKGPPIIGGMGLGHGGVFIRYNEKESSSWDKVAVWGDIGFTIGYPCWHNMHPDWCHKDITKAVGADLTFDGDFSTYWHKPDISAGGLYALANSCPAAVREAANQDFDIASGTTMAVLGARWHNLVGQYEDWILTSPDCKRISLATLHADYAKKGAKVPDKNLVAMTTKGNQPNELLVTIQKPLAGTWNLELKNAGAFGSLTEGECPNHKKNLRGNVCFASHVTTASFESLQIAAGLIPGTNTVEIESTSIEELPDAELLLYAEAEDGFSLPISAAREDLDGGLRWDASTLPAGDYRIHGVLRGPNLQSRHVTAPGTIRLGLEEGGANR